MAPFQGVFGSGRWEASKLIRYLTSAFYSASDDNQSDIESIPDKAVITLGLVSCDSSNSKNSLIFPVRVLGCMGLFLDYSGHHGRRHPRSGVPLAFDRFVFITLERLEQIPF